MTSPRNLSSIPSRLRAQHRNITTTRWRVYCCCCRCILHLQQYSRRLNLFFFIFYSSFCSHFLLLTVFRDFSNRSVCWYPKRIEYSKIESTPTNYGATNLNRLVLTRVVTLYRRKLHKEQTTG